MTTANELEPKIRNAGITADPNVHDDAEDDIPESVSYRITSFGVDFDVAGLVRRINDGDIFVPDFQRGFVWTQKQASQFIESLLLGLPVPGIFLTTEPETEKLMVIDGNQRLRTLQFFYGGEITGLAGVAGKATKFALQGVDEAFEGKTYPELRQPDRRRLDNSLLHATTTRQLFPEEGMSSVFHIFQRLNSAGQQLTPQEIRQAIYRGPLLDNIRELNRNQDWRDIFGPPHPRQKDQELILRFWALYLQSGGYKRPMLGFLNDFAESNRNPDNAFLQNGANLFAETMQMFNAALGRKAFRTENGRQLNAAVFDSMSVALACRMQQAVFPKIKAVKDVHHSLLQDAEYLASVSGGTAREDSVRTRMGKAAALFGSI